MPETTPMQDRMNIAYDHLRATLARMHPDHAEIARRDIVGILTTITVELKKWSRSGRDRQSNTHMPLNVVMHAIYGEDEEEDAIAIVRAYTRGTNGVRSEEKQRRERAKRAEG